MNTLAFAKKLRTRRYELRKRHTQALRSYAMAFDIWKRSLGAWVANTARVNTASLNHKNVYASSRYRDEHYIQVLMKGHPTPPNRPDDSVIKKIDSLLRHLAITGQKTVRVNESTVAELFDDRASDEED